MKSFKFTEVFALYQVGALGVFPTTDSAILSQSFAISLTEPVSVTCVVIVDNQPVQIDGPTKFTSHSFPVSDTSPTFEILSPPPTKLVPPPIVVTAGLLTLTLNFPLNQASRGVVLFES
ncbi:MAG: hypothetical protein LBF15_01685 [Candidatus Peribacteria bacterium]|nr:hypothetical protein [Candidatus Peribacteria bacterium]